jgi:hypothetical protein
MAGVSILIAALFAPFPPVTIFSPPGPLGRVSPSFDGVEERARVPDPARPTRTGWAGNSQPGLQGPPVDLNLSPWQGPGAGRTAGPAALHCRSASGRARAPRRGPIGVLIELADV